MDLNARVDVNCGRKDGWMHGSTDGKNGCLYHTLQMQQKDKVFFFISDILCHITNASNKFQLCHAIKVMHIKMEVIYIVRPSASAF